MKDKNNQNFVEKRAQKITDISKRSKEICDLSNYVSTLIMLESEKIENITIECFTAQNNSNEGIYELASTLSRKRRNNSIYRKIVFFFISFCAFLIGLKTIF